MSKGAIVNLWSRLALALWAHNPYFPFHPSCQIELSPIHLYASAKVGQKITFPFTIHTFPFILFHVRSSFHPSIYWFNSRKAIENHFPFHNSFFPFHLSRQIKLSPLVHWFTSVGERKSLSLSQSKFSINILIYFSTKVRENLFPFHNPYFPFRPSIHWYTSAKVGERKSLSLSQSTLSLSMKGPFILHVTDMMSAKCVTVVFEVETFN